MSCRFDSDTSIARHSMSLALALSAVMLILFSSLGHPVSWVLREARLCVRLIIRHDECPAKRIMFDVM